jgi:hypothetical protein
MISMELRHIRAATRIEGPQIAERFTHGDKVLPKALRDVANFFCADPIPAFDFPTLPELHSLYTFNDVEYLVYGYAMHVVDRQISFSMLLDGILPGDPLLEITFAAYPTLTRLMLGEFTCQAASGPGATALTFPMQELTRPLYHGAPAFKPMAITKVNHAICDSYKEFKLYFTLVGIYAIRDEEYLAAAETQVTETPRYDEQRYLAKLATKRN